MAAVCFSAPRASAQYFSVGINAPMLASGTLNVTLEAAVAPHWSVGTRPARKSCQHRKTGPDSRRSATRGALLVFRGVCRTFSGDARGFGVVQRVECLAPPQRMAFGGRDLLWLLLAALGTLEHDAEGGIGIYHMRESEKRRFTPDSEPEYIRHHRRWVFGPSKCALTFSYLF